MMEATSSSTAAPEGTPQEHKPKGRPLAAVTILIGGAGLLVLALLVSISVGSISIPLGTVWQALFHFNPDVTDHQVIREVRLPRALAGVLVGAGLSVSGAVMQGMTRNPIADPGLLGLNAGAGFVLAAMFAFFPNMSYMTLILYSFVGAGIGAGLVFGIGSLSKSGLTPMRLALSGAAVSALLSALAEGIAVYFKIGQDLAFWYAGGLAGIHWTQVKIMFPWVAAALIGAMCLSRSITVLSLGDEVSSGLGQRNGLIRLGGTLVVLVLAGAAVSAVGAIGFLGLLIPHIVRYLVGVDYRWVIPCSGLFGALLIVVADIGARVINPLQEVPVGGLIALIGVPYFLYLVRKGGRGIR
ncbi:ferrichrome ABC transporter permease [Paenibacillus physcomitrellae]|uniref:Ferrichrome ABC transporter permease n=2 Tax=Paenibacillus physcomitrellae TaxID=1619311 RepID=A0ABQ1GKV2_9BACL|nr:ferrichrome ABC transporter permease [Paenibacillus physcomitrellae]